jgi:hypothetical protein
MRDRGADVAAVRDVLDIHLEAIDALLLRNQRQARALSLPGTPAFVIGKRLHRGALEPEQIRGAVADAQAELDSRCIISDCLLHFYASDIHERHPV